MPKIGGLIALFVFVVVLLISSIVFVVSYACKRQAEIYRQQGIDISAWDVALGIKPNERVIQIKEK